MVSLLGGFQTPRHCERVEQDEAWWQATKMALDENRLHRSNQTKGWEASDLQDLMEVRVRGVDQASK